MLPSYLAGSYGTAPWSRLHLQSFSSGLNCQALSQFNLYFFVIDFKKLINKTFENTKKRGQEWPIFANKKPTEKIAIKIIHDRTNIFLLFLCSEQCDQTLKYKVAQNLPKVTQKVTTEVYTHENWCFQSSLKVKIDSGNFCNKICRQEQSKIAQSGHTSELRMNVEKMRASERSSLTLLPVPIFTIVGFLERRTATLLNSRRPIDS